MIDQDTINRAWVVLAKVTEQMGDELLADAERVKDKNYFESKQVEAAATELKEQSEKMKTKYPHLFVEE